MTRIPAETLEKILYAGSLAPSGDNMQPWAFRAESNQIHLWNVPARDRSFYNWREKGAYVAHGAAIENMVIAARAHGWVPTLRLFPQPHTREHVATIDLQPARVEQHPLYAAVSARCTNRKPYRTTPLSPVQREELLSTPQEVGGGEIRLFEDEESRMMLGAAGALNERVMFATHPMHEHFFHHLRWTDQEERTAQCGLFLKTLELAPPKGLVLRLLRYWPAIRMANRLGFADQVAKENAALNASCAAIGMILIPNFSDEECVRAGRILQRVWLKATHMGLSLQPLIGTVFMIHRVRAGDADILASEHSALLRDTEAAINKIGRIAGETVVALFRIGLSDPPSARSSRYPLAMLLSEDRR